MRQVPISLLLLFPTLTACQSPIPAMSASPSSTPAPLPTAIASISTPIPTPSSPVSGTSSEPSPLPLPMTAHPAPQEVSVIPTVVLAFSRTEGVPGMTVELTGTGLNQVDKVLLAGISLVVTERNPNRLLFTLPNTSNGEKRLEVFTPEGKIAETLFQLVGGTSPSSGGGGGGGGGTSSVSEPAAITLTAPTANAVLTGSVLLQVNVDAASLQKVEYFSNSQKLGESTAAPYALNWDTTQVASGNHILSAKLIDTANQELTSPSVSVRVNQAPVITALTASLNPIPGIPYTTQLQCTATDVEDDVTITWSTVGGLFGTFTPDQSNVYWTAPTGAGGPYGIRCTVSDGLHTVYQDLSVAVIRGNGAVSSHGGLF
jgi:hypothetical protein